MDASGKYEPAPLPRGRRSGKRHHHPRNHSGLKRLSLGLFVAASIIILSVVVTAAVAGRLFRGASGRSAAPLALESPFRPFKLPAGTAARSTAPTSPMRTPGQTSASRSASEPSATALMLDRGAGSFIVCIDAGHQAVANVSLEPIGPGSRVLKPKVAGGTTGVSTHERESRVNLDVALKLRDELVRRGVRVVMVRVRENVDIPNSRRAAIADRAGAVLFLRLHCDGATDRRSSGIMTIVPGANSWTNPIRRQSRVAGKLVHASLLAATGARDRGVVQRADLAGFNWSRVPTVLLEMGFMTNPREDRLLAGDEYQTRLAGGIADGTVRYLQSLEAQR